MAAGFPVKANYATGDVLTATNMNDLAGTLNYIDPTGKTNGYVLTRNSSATGGLEWAAAGGGSTGGMTSIATGSFSGSTVNLTSISGSYKDLKLEIRNLQLSTNIEPTISVNGLTGIYNAAAVWQGGTTGNSSGTYYQNGKTKLELCYDQPKASASISIDIYFHDYTNTTSYKLLQANIAFQNTYNARESIWLAGNATTYNAITDISLSIASGSFNAGTYILYGVN